MMTYFKTASIKEPPYQSVIAGLSLHAIAETNILALINRSLAAVAETLNVEFVKLLKYDYEKKDFLLKAGLGWKEGCVGTARVPGGRNESLAGYTFFEAKPILKEDLVTHEPLVVEDLQEEHRFLAAPLLTEHGIVSGISAIVPLSQTKSYGVLGAHTRERRRFTRDEVLLLEGVANLLGAAISRYFSEERFRGLFASAKDGIVYASLDGRLTDMNESFIRMTGYSQEELVGLKSYQDITAPEYHLFEELMLKELYRTGSSVEYEKEYIRKDGSRLPVLLTVFFVRGIDGGPLCLAAITRDITLARGRQRELFRLTEELRRSNSDLQQFASAASHDLQEPILTTAQLLEVLQMNCREKLTPEDNELVSGALKSTQYMQSLIRDILAYARVDTKGTEFKRVDAGVICGQVLPRLKKACEDARAVIIVGALPSVRADEYQLSQLFQNLLSNGIKFRRKDIRPEIHVSAVRGGAQWIFSIKDNGIGIDPSKKEKIFEMFGRLHTPEDYPGTGIGLAICKKIVQRHGGRIWVERAEGQGTAFFFSLPAADF